MKRRYAAMVLGLALTLGSVNFAYAAGDASAAAEKTTEATTAKEDASEDTDAEQAKEDEIYGEVTEVGKDSITINTGTLKEDALNDNGAASSEKSSDSASEEDKDTADTDSTASEDTDTAKTDSTETENADTAASILDLTGKSQTVTLTDTTVYDREKAPASAEDTQTGTSTDEKAQKDTSEDTAAATESEDKETASDSKDGADQQDKSASDAKQKTETESIKLDDIKVGDVIKIMLDEDGNAETVTVMNNSSGDTEKTAATSSDSSAGSDDASDSTASEK